MVVDLPAPFGPSRLKISPCSNLKIDPFDCYKFPKIFLQILDLNGFLNHLSSEMIPILNQDW